MLSQLVPGMPTDLPPVLDAPHKTVFADRIAQLEDQVSALVDQNRNLIQAIQGAFDTLNREGALRITDGTIDGTPIGTIAGAAGVFTTLSVGTGSSFPAGTWTPTVTAVAGGNPTTVSATGKWTHIGDLYFIRVKITITTNGTAATALQFTLPVTASADSALAGRENNNTGKGLAASIASGASVATVVYYDNTYPGANGNILLISGILVP